MIEPRAIESNAFYRMHRLFLACAFMLLALCSDEALGQEVGKTYWVGSIKGETVWLRGGPSSRAWVYGEVGPIKTGTKVTPTEKDGSFLRIEYKGETGRVSRAYLMSGEEWEQNRAKIKAAERRAEAREAEVYELESEDAGGQTTGGISWITFGVLFQAVAFGVLSAISANNKNRDPVVHCLIKRQYE